MNMITKEFRHKWSDKEVEAHWDSVAHKYVAENEKVKQAHDQRFKESIIHLKLQAGQRVLNISSRDAEADDYIRRAEPESEVINLEISAGLMKEALRLRPQIQQHKINTYSNLPFTDGYFDSILSLETLEHVAEPIKFLEELFRVARPGSRMVLSCPPSSAELAYQVYTFIFGGHGEGPHRFPHPEEVKQMLKITNWKLLDHYGSVLIPVGPAGLQDVGERIIKKYKGTWIANLGIRQFYICERD
jgi:ubiquinone/menaquinone biosynthesis C-methylase UbiE